MTDNDTDTFSDKVEKAKKDAKKAIDDYNLDKQPPKAMLTSVFSSETLEGETKLTKQFIKDSDDMSKKEIKATVTPKKKNTVIFCVPCTQRFILREVSNEKQICPHIIQKVN